MNKFGNKTGKLLLTNDEGKPIVSSRLKGIQVKKSDNVRSAFDRITRKLGIKKTLKHFRKTSSTILGGYPEFGKLGQYFLGQSPRTVADKHYIQPNQEQFDRAVAWLRTEILETAKKPLK